MIFPSIYYVIVKKITDVYVVEAIWIESEDSSWMTI